MEILKREKGITLVALVVTMVVLLILAGITINILFSDNGIIKKAQEAVNKTNQAQIEEQQGLQNLANQLEEYINGIGESENNEPDWDSDKVTKVVVDGKNIPVPKGYILSNAEGEKSVNTGLVLYQGNEGVNNSNVATAKTTRNQFVWIPVEDETTMYETQSEEKVGKLYDFSTTGSTPRTYPGKNTGYREPDIVTGNATGDGTNYDGNSSYLTILGLTSSSEFRAQLQNEFNKMIASIEKYKGFYIGRYETGNLEANTTTPVVQKGNNKNNNVNWYYVYQNSKKIAEGNNAVTSSILWGCQWDRTMQWLVESGNKTYAELMDSKSWGNYKDSTGDAATNSGSAQPTGTNEAWKANNIYDLAGNLRERTIESYGPTNRVFRRRLL